MNNKAKKKSEPLKIALLYDEHNQWVTDPHEYCACLNAMLIAESNLVAAGKDSAMPHLLAIVKELERIHSFKFDKLEETSPNGKVPDSKSEDLGSTPSVSATPEPTKVCSTCKGTGIDPSDDGYYCPTCQGQNTYV